MLLWFVVRVFIVGFLFNVVVQCLLCCFECAFILFFLTVWGYVVVHVCCFVLLSGSCFAFW